jgi:hypothetical protein
MPSTRTPASRHSAVSLAATRACGATLGPWSAIMQMVLKPACFRLRAMPSSTASNTGTGTPRVPGNTMFMVGGS